MKKSETARKTRRNEKRLIRREKSNAISANRKMERRDKAVCQKEILEESIQAMKKNRQKNKTGDKRPGYGKFLFAFSFIRSTPWDKRSLIPSDYRCRSFNEEKQYLDFLKEFIYPYKIPMVLLRTAFEKEFIIVDGFQSASDMWIIRSAKKWINDIVCGDSFYKLNKADFTRGEAHYFLNSEIVYSDPSSSIELVFYAKCMARKIGVKSSRIIAKIFSQKFPDAWDHPIISSFLDLIARSPDYHIEYSGFDDICDFVLGVFIEAHGIKQPFSFSGRTMASVISLANEWHAAIVREQQTGVKQLEINCWKGISISYIRIEDDFSTWSFTQLCSVQALLNEGRLMKNCVSAYSAKCAAGESAIFHVSRVLKDDKVCLDFATLEIDKKRILVQVKGKCNTSIPSIHMKAIKKWAQQNRIMVASRY